MGQSLGCLRPSAADKDDVVCKPMAAAATAPGIKAQGTSAVLSGKSVAALPTVPINADAAVESNTASACDASSQQSDGQLIIARPQPGSPQPGSPEDRLGKPLQPNLPYEVTESGPPLPPCQDARLQSVQLNTILNTAPKDDLQNILKLVCSIFKTENALIALLFDRRVYVTNGTGNFSEGDFPWRYSFCGWTMASEQHTVMIIPDAEQDARFCQSPVAKKYGVRFYAGAPLVSSSGHRLGTLCFADNKPRAFDDSSLRILCNFSELVTRELERDIALAEARQEGQDDDGDAEHQQITAQGSKSQPLLRSLDCLTSAVLLVDTAQPGWAVLYANRGWQQLMEQCHTVLVGVPSAAAETTIVGQTLWPTISQQLQRKSARAGQSNTEKVQQLVKDKMSFKLKGIRISGFGGAAFTLSFRSAGLGTIEGAVNLCLPSYIPESQENSVVAWEGMYFVTVSMHRGQGTGLATIVDSPAEAGSEAPSSASGSTSLFADENALLGPGQVSLATVKYPQVGQVGQKNGGHQWHSIRPTPDLVVLTSSQFKQAQAQAQAPAGVSVSAGQSWDADASCDSNINRTPGGASEGGYAGFGSSSSSVCSMSSIRLSCDSFTSATAARMVCKKIDGLKLGGQIAAGSYGRVFRGEYFGTKVAVKVLDGDAVLRRESATGLCLEALLGEQLKHPNVVSTLAWAVVTGQDRIPKAEKLWGETLDFGKPSVAQNKKAVQAADNPTAAAAGAPSGPAESTAQEEQQSEIEQTGMSRSSIQSLANDSYEEYGMSSIIEGQTWLVMEFMDKGCLQDAVDCGWLRDTPAGPASLVKVIATATEVASGILGLHKAGIVHGDLSAFNVLLTSNDASASLGGRGFVAKISDFGLSRSMEHKSKVVTKTYGTLTHMPPELLEHGITSKAADVYSFGVLLWQMVSSSRAWAGMSHQGVVKAVCIDKLQLQFPEEAPDALAALGEACMSYNPDERPSFEDILDILAPLNDVIVSAEVNLIRMASQTSRSNTTRSLSTTVSFGQNHGGVDKEVSESSSWAMPQFGK